MNELNVKFEELYLSYLRTRKRTLQAEINEIDRQIAAIAVVTEKQKNDSPAYSLKLNQVKPQG